jgi:hypothetical protein
VIAAFVKSAATAATVVALAHVFWRWGYRAGQRNAQRIYPVDWSGIVSRAAGARQ